MKEMTKKELRQLVKQLKGALTQDEKRGQAAIVFERLLSMPVMAQSQHIMLYWSLPDELPTHDVVGQLLALGKHIYLPRMTQDCSLQVVPYAGEDLDDTNRFHVGEPDGEPVSPDCLDVIIVPAVALDRHCNRLGRGKGYYDRLLATVTCTTIGVALDCQLVDNVPVEAHDRPLDCVITPSTCVFNGDKEKLFRIYPDA